MAEQCNFHINKWQNRSESDVQERTKWITHFTYKVADGVTDKIAHEASAEAHQSIDCLDCGNCCRTSVTDFNAQDISRAAKAIGVSKKAFIKKYLMKDHDDKYVTITSPCPFLNLQDNKCTIYEVRPYVCQSYPHTHKDGFSKRKIAHINNLDICPITYLTVEKMWEKLNLDS